ncbi:MAG TPA: nucleotidyltransferase domain-containing protein [Thermotogota bacterium]|nr:nucleotidyltransferase domain-containing protein [Thermotogota bacterium]HPJ88891.1 nucleotidyltransferase domain-containing protein [Thermotogota bacterium]HPR96175.1 nucleotidyltransferase domain-containing protein [Thermotogota bacterium]
MTRDQIKQIIRQELLKHKDVKIIYLFGSITKQNFREDSDVDCAVLTEEINFFEKYLKTKFIIEEKINRDLDLIDLKSIDPGFAAEIVSKGELLYSDLKETAISYKMSVLSDYIQLEEDRKPVIDAIYKRGSVYGSGNIGKD